MSPGPCCVCKTTTEFLCSTCGTEGDKRWLCPASECWHEHLSAHPDTIFAGCGCEKCKAHNDPNGERLRKAMKMTEVQRILAEVEAEVARQDEQWGVEHDEQKYPTDWIAIVIKQLGLAFTQFEQKEVYLHERGLDGRFIKVAAIAVSAVRSIRRQF